MRFRASLVAIVAMAACAPMPPPQPPTPPAPPAVRTVAVFVMSGDRPVPGASCAIDEAPAPRGVANADGYVAFDGIATSRRDLQLSCSADGYFAFSEHRSLTTDSNEDLAPVSLPPMLPPPPTRDEMLNVRLTFQGLIVQTEEFGTLPWFEAALPWLNADDRQAVYAAKHASTAWPGGDTHAIIMLPSGPPLYDEPGQPYSADRFGALDWTAGNTHIDERLADLVVEVARAGFTRQLLFLYGDDGERGFPVAMAQLDLVYDALAHSKYGDLRGYVVPLPGWDGVFYGYTPQHIYDWGGKCRTLFPYCGLEHSTGHIPAGEGPQEWRKPNGPMRVYDLILGEFIDDRFDDTVWQIAGRMLGPDYRRPADQPAADDPNPPFYLSDPTDRGPIRHCAFEFYEYGFVRGASVDRVNAARDYFKRIGYTCGG
jgi:hypothetical protein